MSFKVLTVDDSKLVRMLVSRAFASYDCQLLEASDGAQCLNVARESRPDLILLDYTMPVMDGLETMTQLRADSQLRTIPVVMLTAEASREVVAQLAALGVRDYLVKPFKPEMIIDRLSRILPLNSKSATAKL